MIFTDINIFILLSTILIIAVVNDLRFQKIPNILTFPAMIVAIVAVHGEISVMNRHVGG